MRLVLSLLVLLMLCACTDPGPPPGGSVAELQRIDAVVGTSMTAIVPRKVAERSPHFGRIAIFEPPFKLAPLNHKLIWHRRNENDPAHVWLRDFLKNFSRSPAFASH